MKDYKQIFRSEQMEGKTIAKANESNGNLYLIFTDDTFVCIAPGEEDVEVAYWDMNLLPTYRNVFDLNQAGFIEDDEFERLQKMFVEQEQKEQEIKDREALARLKAKYEK